jgi:glucose-6-phosphate dehydrogenase assembly protein OpcA
VNEWDALETFRSGRPREVDVAAIERELQLVWRAASETETGDAVLRASMLNFIVYTSERDADMSSVVARVSADLPCRAFVLMDADPMPSHPPLEAWISSHCQPAGPGGKQVCCEQITIRVTPAASESLPSTLLALLVPDLPTALWWPGDVALEGPLLSRLARDIDLLVVDSTTFGDVPRGMSATARWSWHDGRAVADLAWARLDPWRELAAAPFDSPACAAFLPAITAVEIEHTAGARSMAFLLTGWLASRLGWRVAKRETDDVQLRSERTEVRVRFASSTHPAPGAAPTLVRVLLRAADGTALCIGCDADQPLHLTARFDSATVETPVRALAVRRLDTGAELVRALSRPRRNLAFAQALQAAAEIAGAG